MIWPSPELENLYVHVSKMLYTKQKLSTSDIPELPHKVFNISAGLTKFTIFNAQFSQEINLRQPTIVCS